MKEVPFVRVIIVGGAGNVGKGILQSCISRPAGAGAWNDVISIDPTYYDDEDTSRTCTSSNITTDSSTITSSAAAANTDGGTLFHQQIKSRIEDIDEQEFQSWFNGAPYQQQQQQKKQHPHARINIEFIVTHDSGNREDYTNDPNLGCRNDARFESLVERISIAAAAARENSSQQLKLQKGCSEFDLNALVSVHVSYIGGSWTRRQQSQQQSPPYTCSTSTSDDDENDADLLVIHDDSSAKTGGGSNPYEIAKSNAQTNAQKVSSKYAIPITFYDYISIVPNYAPNFSVNQMVRSGLECGVIKFSPGGYGRCLLHAAEAGCFVVKLMEKRMEVSRSSNKERLFETILVPGHFVRFQTFANIAKEVLAGNMDRCHDGEEIRLETYAQTPDELRSRCISPRGIDVGNDSSMVLDGLKEAAVYSLKRYREERRVEY